VNDVDAERNEWDRQAADDPRRAVWAEDPASWDADIDWALARIGPELDRRPRVTGRVLDLGCGMGRLAVPFAAANPDTTVVGVDVSWRMLDAAAVAARSAAVGNVELWLGDGRRLPDQVGQVDAAWSMVTFQHIPAEAVYSYIEQVADRLVDGGPFVAQYVEGTTDQFLARDLRTIPDVLTVCAGAGLEVVGVESDKRSDDRYPTWRWATCIRRSRAWA